MNTKLLIVLSIGLLTAACSASNHRASVDNCVITIPPDSCTSRPTKNEIRLIVSSPELQVAPKNVCIDPKLPIEVKVVQGEKSVTVFSVPKDAKNGWILATNKSDPSKMTINVTEGTLDGDYDYLFITSDGRCYDPRIHLGPE